MKNANIIYTYLLIGEAMRKYSLVFILFLLIFLTVYAREVKSDESFVDLIQLTNDIKEYNGGKNYGVPTLVKTLRRGVLHCGIKDSAPGFAFEDEDGQSGFDVDFCRGIAAAIFGDASKVEFVLASAGDRFELLRNGDIDVLVRTTTHTLSRDSEEGVDFAPTTFYDGQGFMASSASETQPIRNMVELKLFIEDKKVCVREDTTTASNLEDLQSDMEEDGKTFSILTFADPFTPYFNDECDVVSSDKSGLAGEKSINGDSDDTILEVAISKEPLAPLVRHGDNHWKDLVSWVVYALFFADEHNISQSGIDLFVPTTSEEESFLGISGALGKKIFLSDDWAAQVVKAIGNYTDIYERNLDPIGLDKRGLNMSYTEGGLLYAPPFK